MKRLLATYRVGDGLCQLVNRLSLSIVIAILGVSLAMLITVTATGSTLQFFILVGCIISVGLGIWKLISILGV
jgi:hypothetical protein